MESYSLCSYNQVKHISHGGLENNIVLEGQKLLVSTMCFKCSFFVVFFVCFSTLKGGSSFGKYGVWTVAGGDVLVKTASTGCLKSSQLLLWPIAVAQVTFTSICAAQGALVLASSERGVCAESRRYRRLRDSVHASFHHYTGSNAVTASRF